MNYWSLLLFFTDYSNPNIVFTAQKFEQLNLKISLYCVNSIAYFSSPQYSLNYKLLIKWRYFTSQKKRWRLLELLWKVGKRTPTRANPRPRCNHGNRNRPCRRMSPEMSSTNFGRLQRGRAINGFERVSSPPRWVIAARTQSYYKIQLHLFQVFRGLQRHKETPLKHSK